VSIAGLLPPDDPLPDPLDPHAARATAATPSAPSRSASGEGRRHRAFADRRY